MLTISIQRSIARCVVALESKLTDAGKHANPTDAHEYPRYKVYQHPELDEFIPEGTEAKVAHLETQLETQLEELREIQSWMNENSDVTNMIDEALDHQARATQRQRTIQRRRAIRVFVIVIIALVAGWLLSALVPATVVGHLFGR